MLCMLAAVKQRNVIPNATTTFDDLLTRAIRHASAKFEKYCNRVFGRTVGATYGFNAAHCELAVRNYPIESVSAFAVKTNETDGFVAQTPDYFLRSVDGEACIVSLSAPLGSSSQLGQVTLTGGYVLPGDFTRDDSGTPVVTDGQTALPDDIEQACIEQVSYWWQRRSQLGITEMGGRSAEGFKLPEDMDLLPAVKASIHHHKRYVL